MKRINPYIIFDEPNEEITYLHGDFHVHSLGFALGYKNIGRTITVKIPNQKELEECKSPIFVEKNLEFKSKSKNSASIRHLACFYIKSLCIKSENQKFEITGILIEKEDKAVCFSSQLISPIFKKEIIEPNMSKIVEKIENSFKQGNKVVSPKLISKIIYETLIIETGLEEAIENKDFGDNLFFYKLKEVECE